METTMNFGIDVSHVENGRTPSAVAMTVLTTMFVIIAHAGLSKGFHYIFVICNKTLLLSICTSHIQLSYFSMLLKTY